ncbi:MAG: aldehyde-activating protein [Hyphomonadaceae bacterium]
MIYRGACHCGVVSAEYETDQPVRLRQDGCGFCSSRGVKSASDPEGRLALSASQQLNRYRFGHKTADFLICPACGTYVATQMQSPRGAIGVINVVGLQIKDLRHLPATLTSLEGESVEERIARRVSRWTPMTLNEPEQAA